MLGARLVHSRLFPRIRNYSDAQTPGPNAELAQYLIDTLQEEKESPTKNKYKLRALGQAITAVQNTPYAITSGKEAIKLPRVGKSTADRIEMFLQGKTYGSEHEAAQRERYKLSKALQSIHGLGSHTADSLIADGVTSLADLRHSQHFRRLSPAQRIGLVYAKPLSEPVAREDAETIADFIKDHISSNFTVELMGAHRRELATFPSVSILLTHSAVVHVPVPSRAKPPPIGSGRVPSPFSDIASKYTVSPFFKGTKHESTFALAHDAIRPLEDAGLVAATIVQQSRRWAGVAALPTRTPDGREWGNMGERLRDIRRRRGRFLSLQISLAPQKSLGAARLFLTGDDDFIRVARITAMRQGLLLNEYGLWRWMPGPRAPSGQVFPDRPAVGRGAAARKGAVDEGLEGSWELLETESEDELLKTLGMSQLPPAKRNFMFLRPRADTRAEPQLGKGNVAVVPPEEVLDAMHQDLLASGGTFSRVSRRIGRPRAKEIAGVQEVRPRGRPKKELPESPVPPDWEG